MFIDFEIKHTVQPHQGLHKKKLRGMDWIMERLHKINIYKTNRGGNMKKELIRTLTQHFESVSHKADDVEYWLSRYACYLIAQNGDRHKDQIAFATIATSPK